LQRRRFKVFNAEPLMLSALKLTVAIIKSFSVVSESLFIMSANALNEATLFYFHDPMCSWCWGYQPVFRQLKAALPQSVSLRHIVGGLAKDTDQPMPAAMQAEIQNIWRRIERELGTVFNYDFWALCQPRRSTFMACRAVLAARFQGAEEAMIVAIAKAYYLRAMNPSDLAVLLQLADELCLDVTQFESDIASTKLKTVFDRELAMARSWPINGFPSLVLALAGERHPLLVDYRDHRTTLQQITALL
jgi:putative protein-disulfide isomerase